jgi:GNAT superfamily N-acetyltransferase
MRIGRAVEADLAEGVGMMRELAVIEGRIDQFAVTEQVLLEQGFRRSPPDFYCFVTEKEGEGEYRLAGMVTYYFVRFTTSARPTLFIAELFVRDRERHRKVGEQLMRRVAKEAVRAGCDLVRWRVAPSNTATIRFFEHLGARADSGWLDYTLPESALRGLLEER